MDHDYLVQHGDSLSSISNKLFGSPAKWPELARHNGIMPPFRIFTGQVLRTPPPSAAPKSAGNPESAPKSDALPTAALGLAHGYGLIFVHQLPEVGKTHVIRKVIIEPSDFTQSSYYKNGKLRAVEAHRQWVPSQPEKFGVAAPNPQGVHTAAEHAQGFNLDQSQYFSTSNKPFGPATVRDRRPVLIDLEKLKKSGAKMTPPQVIVAELRRIIASGTGDATRLQRLIKAVTHWEGETLFEGKVGPSAISKPNSAHTPYIKKAEELARQFEHDEVRLTRELAKLEGSYASAMKVARGLRVVGWVGVAFSAIDVLRASKRSWDQQSFKPIGAESVRQVGGWAAGLAGAKLGGVAGAAMGIETGPGAILTAAAGAVIVGAGGYFGADWAADMIDPN